MKLSKTFKNLKIPTKMSLSQSHSSFRPIYSLNETKFCLYHRQPFTFFCNSCNLKLCLKCTETHQNHKIFKIDEILIPTEAKIRELKNIINLYNSKFILLLNEIKKWKNILDEKIYLLEKCINNNNLLNFIRDYNGLYSKDEKSLIQINEILSRINDKFSNNYVQNYQNQPEVFYNYRQFLNSKFLLNQLINDNQENSFYNNGNEIIKYLKDIPDNVKFSENNRIQSIRINLRSVKNVLTNTNIDNKKKNSRSKSYNSSDFKKILDFNEKYKTLYLNNNNYNSQVNILNKNKTNIKNDIKNNKLNLSFNGIANSFYTKKICDKNLNKSTNKIKNEEPKKEGNETTELFNTSDNEFSFDKNKKINRNSKSTNNFFSPKGNFKYVFNYEEEKNLNDSCLTNCNILTRNKNNPKKTYIHQKNQLSLNISTNSSFLDGYNNKFSKNNRTISQDGNYIVNKTYRKPMNTYIKISKTPKDKIFKITPEMDLSLGLELDNMECKLSLLNQINNNIELINFEKDLYSIPTIIYLDPKSELILIGNEAKNKNILNPKQTIFYLIKMFAFNFNDLVINRAILPFNIYKDNETGKNYLLLDYNNKKKVKFLVEDLLNLYLIELFKLFLSKISIDSQETEKIINFNICISIPNYFDYLSRKKIEKLFKNEKFIQKLEYHLINNNITSESNISLLNSKNNNNFNNTSDKIFKNHKQNIKLNIKNIKIINCSNLPSLFMNYIPKISNSSNNILIINLSGDSVNISIVSINKNSKNFEVKNVSFLCLGEEDINENFLMNNILKEFDPQNYLKCIENGSALMKLRNACEISKKMFEKKSHFVIKINKLIEDTDLKMTLYKSDYDKSCLMIFTKIITLIKKTIYEINLNEMDINDILLIGYTARYNEKFISMLRDLFKHNRSLINNNNFLNYDQNEFYTVSAAALQFINKYNFINICPMTFGIINYYKENEVIISKGEKIPIQKKKIVRLKKEGRYAKIEIYEKCEGMKNKIILKEKMKINEEMISGMEYIEEVIMFEIDDKFNFIVSVLNGNDDNKKKAEFKII